MAKDTKSKTATDNRTRLLAGIAIALAVIGCAIVFVVSIVLSMRPADGTPSNPDSGVTTTVARVTTTRTTVTTTVTSTSTTVMTTTTTTTTITATTAATTVTTATTAAPTYPVNGTWNLVLVNSWNKLSESEANDRSMLVSHSNGIAVDKRMAQSLSDMLSDGAAYGLYLTSGYRDYTHQSRLYENKVQRVLNAEGCSREEALDIAATVVARPGTSEHHTGLAVDLLHNECWVLEEYWDQSAAFDWLVAHCHEYGFILRYPKEKQHITGVIYEPWHYRYVGVEAATEIMGRGITLEEYLEEKDLS